MTFKSQYAVGDGTSWNFEGTATEFEHFCLQIKDAEMTKREKERETTKRVIEQELAKQLQLSVRIKEIELQILALQSSQQHEIIDLTNDLQSSQQHEIVDLTNDEDTKHSECSAEL